MRTKTDLYIKQLETSYNGEPWLGTSIASKLKDVSAELAYARPMPDSHSIIEYVHHIICWREVLIMRLEGDFETKIAINSERDWKTYPYAYPDHKTWNAVLHKLDKSQNRLIDLLKNTDDDFLDKEKNKKKYDFETLLSGVIQHDIYHLGQIALVKSQLEKQLQMA